MYSLYKYVLYMPNMYYLLRPIYLILNYLSVALLEMDSHEESPKHEVIVRQYYRKCMSNG